MLTISEILPIENTNWGVRDEHLLLVNNNGTFQFINNDKNEPARKFLLKRTGDYPQDYAKYLINNSSLKIEDIGYYNPQKSQVIKYNERGRIDIRLQNNSAIDFKQINISLTADDFPDRNIGKPASQPLAGNTEQDFSIPVSSDFSLTNDSVRFTVTASIGTVVFNQQNFAIPSEAFFKTSQVNNVSYAMPRIKAVAGFYGIANTPYQNVSKPLDPLVTAGDAMAAMWKGIFLYFGYGEYKTDESAGYALCKANIKSVENKARAGDAEALYLMFYACGVGLEGEDAISFGPTFLQKSADAGFAPAIYDNGIEYYHQKDYDNAKKYLLQSFAEGIQKSAEVIGFMYEKGYGVDVDLDSAIAWYKRGIEFGDPDAMLMYAYSYEKGFDNSPPDINKALDLASKAALKNSTAAMIFSGRIYLNGREGIARNVPLAVKWFKQGAELGNSEAMFELGNVYRSDIPGFTKDDNSAFFWIKKSAEAGCPNGMIVVSKFYNEGEVTDKDIIKGRYWYKQATLHGVGQQQNDAMDASIQDFQNFWEYADFSPSYYLENDDHEIVGDSGDGFIKRNDNWYIWNHVFALC